MPPTHEHLIEKYNLAPHPEGGFFREIYRSGQCVESPIAGARRDAVTHIYFLLIAGQVSRFHRVLHDEIRNHYEGAPLRLLRFDGQAVAEELIGPGCGGFDFADFSFLSDHPEERRRFERACGEARFF